MISCFFVRTHFFSKLNAQASALFCIIPFICFIFLHLFLQVLQEAVSLQRFLFSLMQEEFHLFQIYLLFLLFVCAMLTIAKTLS